MNPIETHYKGYRFRSRLEARWAVFFDALGLGYRYEPEGFRLADGTAYLPDFFLPQWDAWVEIKPLAPAERDLQRYRLFDTQGSSFLLLYGDIYDACYGAWWRIWTPYRTQRKPGRSVRPVEELIASATLHRCGRCREGWYLGENRMGAEMVGLEACGPILGCPGAPTLPTPQIEQAYTAARSARFEHGEMPVVMRPVRIQAPRPAPRLLCHFCGGRYETLIADSICANCAQCPVCHNIIDVDTMRCTQCVLCEGCDEPIDPTIGLCPDCDSCLVCYGNLQQRRAEDGALICDACPHCERCGAFIEEEDATDASPLCGWCNHMWEKCVME